MSKAIASTEFLPILKKIIDIPDIPIRELTLELKVQQIVTIKIVLENIVPNNIPSFEYETKHYKLVDITD